jgi:CrcB protein
VITYLWIALGGALGSVARFGCSSLMAAWLGERFPWGTLLVNVLGSFTIGLLAALAGSDGRPLVAGDLRQFLLVGVLGGYTTFSSFSLQTLALAEQGEAARAGLYVVGSVALCLTAAWLGQLVSAGLGAAKPL